MLKHQKLILIAIFLFTFSVYTYPSKSVSLACTSPYLTLFPPICYTDEIYDIQDSDNNSQHINSAILHDDNTKIEIHFKLFDVVVKLFNKMFKKQNNNEKAALHFSGCFFELKNKIAQHYAKHYSRHSHNYRCGKCNYIYRQS